MENQKKNKIIASALVCLIAFFAICLLLGTNIRINQNKAELASSLKKLRFDIEGRLVDTHINSEKRGAIVDENELEASDIVTNTISYLDDYFEDENVISLKKVEEDENLRLYKLQFKIGDKVSEFYVTKDGENIFMGDFLSMKKKDAEVQAGFLEKDGEARLVNDKVPLYFYGVSSCPHSLWQYEVVSLVKARFGKNIVIYDYMDSDDDEDYFFKYSNGSMPLIVIADRYYRVGSGEKIGKEKDIEAIISLICSIKEIDGCE